MKVCRGSSDGNVSLRQRGNLRDLRGALGPLLLLLGMGAQGHPGLFKRREMPSLLVRPLSPASQLPRIPLSRLSFWGRMEL